MPFNLIQDRPIYLKVVDNTADGTFEGGVYFPPTSTTTYVPFEGDWEPTDSSQRRTITEKGLNSEDSIMLFSTTDLKVSKHTVSGLALGDRFYLDDPNVVSDTDEYLIIRKDPWQTDSGFKLLNEDGFDYTCIRKELN